MATNSDNPYQFISSYLFPSPANVGMTGPLGLPYDIRQAAGRALGYGGEYGDYGHLRYLQSVPELDPYMTSGDPNRQVGGLSQAQHQALARMHGYSGSFDPSGQGGHMDWLMAEPGRREDWKQFRDVTASRLGLNAMTPRQHEYQGLLNALATQKASLGGSFAGAMPSNTPMDLDQPTVDVFPRIASGMPTANVANVTIPEIVPDKPFSPFADGLPQPYWELAGLGSDAGTGAPHTQYLPERGVYLGDLRLASRLMGYDQPFGGGRQRAWAEEQFGGWGPVEAQAMAVEQARRAYEAQAYGIDPLRWTKPGPLPHEIDPRFGVPFGLSRGAMRDLGFGDDFGAGRGNEFVGMLTPDIVEQALHLLRYPAGPHRLDEVTLAPMQATPPPDDTAFQPNYALFYNPALMNAMTGEGMFPQYDAPWFAEMPMGNGGDTNGGSSGAGRFLGGQAGQGGFELSPDLQELANQEWIAAPPGHHSPVIRNPFFIGYRYGTQGLPLQYPLDNT